LSAFNSFQTSVSASSIALSWNVPVVTGDIESFVVAVTPQATAPTFNEFISLEPRLVEVNVTLGIADIATQTFSVVLTDLAAYTKSAVLLRWVSRHCLQV
jgi:hypothetical protein